MESEFTPDDKRDFESWLSFEFYVASPTEQFYEESETLVLAIIQSYGDFLFSELIRTRESTIEFKG